MSTAQKLTPDSSDANGDSQSPQSGAQRHILKRPIIATTRKNVVTVIQQVMEEMGARGGVSQVTSAKEAKEALEANPQSFLFVDWQLGPDIAVQMLKAGRDGAALNLRPLLLILPNVTAEAAATAMEYCVTKVMAGQFTAPSLQEQVEQIKKIQEADAIIAQQMRKISDARKSGDRDAAAEMISSLHELHPNDQRITVEYAEQLIEDDKWREAEEILEPICAKELPYLRALSAYSRCLLKRGSGGNAENILKKAKLINPYDVDRLVELGDVLLFNGKIEEAQENFSQAIQLDRTNKEAKIGKATCNLLQDEINSALNLVQEIASPRELASIFNTAAIMASRDSKFEHAVKLYQTAEKIVAKNQWLVARLAYNQGLAFNKWNKLNEARKMFEKAVLADPEFKKAARSAQSMGVGGKPVDAMESMEETIQVGERLPVNVQSASAAKSVMDELDKFEEGLPISAPEDEE